MLTNSPGRFPFLSIRYCSSCCHRGITHFSCSSSCQHNSHKAEVCLCHFSIFPAVATGITSAVPQAASTTVTRLRSVYVTFLFFPAVAQVSLQFYFPSCRTGITSVLFSQLTHRYHFSSIFPAVAQVSLQFYFPS